MPKSKMPMKAASSGMVAAPFIYVTDPTYRQIYVNDLIEMIPHALHTSYASWERVNATPSKYESSDKVVVIADTNGDNDIRQKIKNAHMIRNLGIDAHFVTVNIMNDVSKISSNDRFGADHLDIAAGPDTGSKIYKWLFSVLTVRETLHLIPEEQMKQRDDKFFPDYAYCPLSEAKNQPKDAKVQFVALIASKPQVVEGKKLVWEVADRSGTANFYFQYRGPSSQYTWDWVLSMGLGDRRALPRMPMVEIKEKKRVQVLKAPFRLAGSVIECSGLAVKAVGKGICRAGGVLKIGPRSEWVNAYDVGRDGQKIDWAKFSTVNAAEGSAFNNKKKTIDVFNEKGELSWSDEASVASTDVDDMLDEKSGKELL